MSKIEFLSAGPLVSIQDRGRYNALSYGIAASGPMDRVAFKRAGALLKNSRNTGNTGNTIGNAAVECAGGKLEFVIRGKPVLAAFCGGEFLLEINGTSQDWERSYLLNEGDMVKVEPGPEGNYALIRFNHEIDVPHIIGSQSTNTIAHLGGFEGRLIKSGDIINLSPAKTSSVSGVLFDEWDGAIRFIWGLHAECFSMHTRDNFVEKLFIISPMLNRMGVRLEDKNSVFAEKLDLSLVSDAVVPGDIQILGDGTPIVLMRDHQPTGGYPRIATIISADLSRFSQMRPGCEVKFLPVNVDRAHDILKETRK